MAIVVGASLIAPRPHAVVEATRLNDNRIAAGTLRNGVLHIALEARLSEWHPDGVSAPGVVVPTFR